MNLKTDLRAGMTFEECDQQRNYWKKAAQSGRCNAGNPYPPPPPPPQPTPYPYPPQPSGYYDYSGYCG